MSIYYILATQKPGDRYRQEYGSFNYALISAQYHTMAAILPADHNAVVIQCDGTKSGMDAAMAKLNGQSVPTSPYWDKPLAVAGLTSYRYRSQYGWIMIGARDHADALREAARSTDNVTAHNLQVWNGSEYVPTNPVREQPYAHVLDYYGAVGRAVLQGARQ